MRSEEILKQDTLPAAIVTGQGSAFLIQVIHRDTGQVVQWIPGRKVEKALVSELCDRMGTVFIDDFLEHMSQQKVGFFKTRTAVIEAIHEALRVKLPLAVSRALSELLHELKAQV